MINSDLVHNCTADSAESACYVESVKNECGLDLIDFTHIFSLMGKDVALLSMEGLKTCST